jgi:hypothetical protein
MRFSNKRHRYLNSLGLLICILLAMVISCMTQVRNVREREFNEKEFGEDEIETLADDVTHFSLAGIHEAKHFKGRSAV